MKINYYTQECNYTFKNRRKNNLWIKNTVTNEGKIAGEISVIFCSDNYLLEINKKHLNHDYFTDIITFDYSEENMVGGDLFISIDTVRTNAEKYGDEPKQEILRVIIHGVLHLCGYKDKTASEAKIMREKENFYLAQLNKDEASMDATSQKRT